MKTMQQVRHAVANSSLRSRLIAIMVALLLTALALTGFGVQQILGRYLENQVDDQLIASYHKAQQDNGFLRNITQPGGHRRGGPTQFAIHVSVDGYSQAETTSIPAGNSVPRFGVLTYQQAQNLAGKPFTLESNGEHQWRAVAIPTACAVEQAAGDLSTQCTVTLALPLADAHLATQRLRLLMLLIGLAVGAACAVAGWLAVRRAFQPLRQVENTAARIAEGDLSQRIPHTEGASEVRQLTTSLNQMLGRIESAFRAQEESEARTRRFAADASHELRTPLAAIRGFAELYRQGAVPAADVPRTMGRIENEATRMGTLVDDLLLLARLDEQRPIQQDRVDITALCRDSVHDAHALDSQREIRLVGLNSVTPPESMWVMGDENQLRQILSNLMANAIKHTPAGTPVEVAVGTADTDAILEIRDHGTGLSEEQRSRMFERFYRVDASRQRDTGGAGLGLSIVSALARAHGGQASAEPTRGGGTTLRVTLPLAPEPDSQ